MEKSEQYDNVQVQILSGQQGEWLTGEKRVMSLSGQQGSTGGMVRRGHNSQDQSVITLMLLNHKSTLHSAHCFPRHITKPAQRLAPSEN